MNPYWTLQSPNWIFQDKARVQSMDFSERGKNPESRYSDSRVVSLVFFEKGK